MGLGSRIRKKPIPDPGSRGQKGTVSRIRIRNTAGYSALLAPKKKCGSRQISVADPDPGSGAFLTPGSGMVFSGSRIPDLVSRILNPYF